ncbi:MAG: hypothetical protein KDK78_11135, partial [Chlamydiia bacterium]|nr:hypothetical protein [Chlamydiia bacterium]
LSKMKPKEASAVLDTWAENKDPRVSAFYREVTAAYLNNKRYDANPQAFEHIGEREKGVEGKSGTG